MQYTVIHYRDASMVLTGQLHFTVIYNLVIFILLHFGRKLGAIAKNFCQNCFLFDRHWMDVQLAVPSNNFDPQHCALVLLLYSSNSKIAGDFDA